MIPQVLLDCVPNKIIKEVLTDSAVLSTVGIAITKPVNWSMMVSIQWCPLSSAEVNVKIIFCTEKWLVYQRIT